MRKPDDLDIEQDSIFNTPRDDGVPVVVIRRAKYETLVAERDALRAQVNALPRPAILEFARLMEAKLAEKDALGYPDWRDETPLQHLFAIMEEWQETNVEMGANEGDGSRDAEARWEACDVALRSMMLCDVLEPLCDHDGRGRAKGGNDGV